MNRIAALQKQLGIPLSKPKIQLARGPRLITYYPPDINFLALSRQDPKLAQLNLVDVPLQEQVKREIDAAARGKHYRVYAETGLRRKMKKESGKAAGGKKKKR